ncbi:uncharacterized protein LOC124429780 [Vespa crabro]|uniref:uncharacterized protein LOC124429780 n=1 Tax=Vespa crabro TaxID=7445 RepID=UPI001EFFCE9D|nr:uncharacterized protein LOC124429780 [Vespa crabro]
MKLIFEDIWRTESFPEEWKVALIHALHKKEDKRNDGIYKGISLLQTAYKDIFAKFLDFKKAIDSVDTENLGKAIREFGVKNKLANLIRETLTDTISKIKFMGEISNPIEINTDVRQGDGLSPPPFNCVLKIIGRITKIKIKEHNISLVTLGGKSKGIELCCLAFADGFAKRYWCNGKNKEIQIPSRINSTNGLEKSAVEERLRKMEIANGITKHYATIVNPECLYASDCLVLNYRLDKLEVLERRIMRKILGPVKTTKVWNLISNDDIYRNKEDMTETIKNGRLQFFGYIYRIDESRLSKRILMYLWEEKATTSWIQEVKKDLERSNLSEEEVIVREISRKKLLKMEVFQARLKK